MGFAQATPIARSFPAKRAAWIPVLVLTTATLAIGSLTGLASLDALDGWYGTLNKPFFTPANAVFPLVWTVLYLLMGSAAGLVWSRPVAFSWLVRARSWYIIQLALNAAWSLL